VSRLSSRRCAPAAAWTAVLCLAATLAFAGERPDEPAKPEGPEKPAAPAAKGDVLAEFPWKNRRQPLIAPVKIGGEEYLFMVDTGSTFNMFDTSLKDKLGKRIRTGGLWTHGGEVQAALYAPAQASIAGLDLCAGEPVVCMDLGIVRAAAGYDIRGIVGMRFLKRHVLRMDCDVRKWQLLRPDAKGRDSWGAPVALRSDPVRLTPSAAVCVQGAGFADFRIDTGDSSAGVLPKFAFETAVRGEKTTEVTATAAGERHHAAGRTGLVILGGLAENGLVFDSGSEHTLGLEYLSRFTVTLDFPAKKLYLRKGKRFGQPDNCAASGLRLALRKGRTLVHSVRAGSEAELAGLKRGDEILEFDGKKVAEFSLGGLRLAVRDAEGRKVSFLVRRGENELTVRMTPKDPLARSSLPPIFKAVLANDAEALAAALKKGAKVDGADAWRTTALQVAAMAGRTKMAELLLEKGARPDAADSAGMTPLHLTVASDSSDIARMLVAKGAKVDAKAADGTTALHRAAWMNRPEIVKLLLAAKAKVDAPAGNKNVPLVYAAAAGNLAVAEMLLDAGADPRARSGGGATPLVIAAASDRIGVMKLLLARGAMIEDANDAGATALHWAALGGRTAAARLLLEKGAVAGAASKDGTTPLHVAAGRGERGIVLLLLKAGARLEQVNKKGETALYVAAAEGQIEVLRLLLERGGKIEARTARKWTPLMGAIMGTHEDVALLLLEKGARGKRVGGDVGALHAAAGIGSVKLVEKLLAGGASLERKDGGGNTPLHTAVWMQRKAVVELLLRKGAKVNAESRKGLRPLDYARTRKNKELIDLLVKHGAKERSKLFGGDW
jgi:cytohesin